MSKTIDERVVEMRFDNKQFEQNVQTSISSIEKLEKSLNLKGASKGLDDVNAAAKNCNMTPLSNAVETVKMRFSALEVMAVTALANITNSALNAGKNIVSALTIDPIKTGFQEYETQINAVQTILANTQSKGTTIDQVNAALDELNKYADQTIYNFTEMTRNIGTFTAAGVDLDKSVTSIKGIANLAAASGSNAYQASTAMYQLSQAIAAGKVSLQDWNSVVNAGMGGQLFQDALTRTAEHFGTNMDAMIEQYGSFRASLTEGGWLTTEVLTETLTQLSGAYSEADLIAQGYTEEQAKEITKLAQTALDAATKVKTFTQLWDTLKESVQSGWTQSWEIIIGDFEEAKELLTEYVLGEHRQRVGGTGRFFHGSRCRRSGIRAIDPSYFRTFGRHCCVGSRMSGRRCWHSRIFHWTFCFGSIWSGGSSISSSGSIQYSQFDSVAVRIYRGRNPFSCWSNRKWRASYCRGIYSIGSCRSRCFGYGCTSSCGRAICPDRQCPFGSGRTHTDHRGAVIRYSDWDYSGYHNETTGID